MRIREIAVHNYKSLRDTIFTPSGLTVLTGPNGAGKSNFCDALDFIGQMYRWNLELAVARHGGYENICYRHSRRSKNPITVRISATFSNSESSRPFLQNERLEPFIGQTTLRHSLSFGTTSQRIEAPFSIENELITWTAHKSQGHPQAVLMRMERREGRIISVDFTGIHRRLMEVNPEIGRALSLDRPAALLAAPLPSTQSMMSALEQQYYYSMVFPQFGVHLGAIRVYQITPDKSRDAGVPTPNPELERSGSNLPAILRVIREERPDQFAAMIQTMRYVMPSIEDVSVVVNTQKTLSLSFKEVGFGRHWTSEDVSDGTIRTLALLAAVFDPSVSVTAIEEPENSLHPWAIRHFVDACRRASTRKQIIITTHSPTLINHVKAGDVWIVSRPAAETTLQPLADLDPQAVAGWDEGSFTLSEYLDSGAVRDAVPSLAE